MSLEHPFSPFIDAESHILILGTFPSIDSFKVSFYYGHKRNQFWKILGEIFDMATDSLEQRQGLLHKRHIALWDMVSSCNRTNSLDSNLRNIEVNDIRALLGHYPKIEAIFFTGVKAGNLYRRHFGDIDIPAVTLPSPSPANQRKSYQEKLEIYREWIEKHYTLP